MSSLTLHVLPPSLRSPPCPHLCSIAQPSLAVRPLSPSLSLPPSPHHCHHCLLPAHSLLTPCCQPLLPACLSGCLGPSCHGQTKSIPADRGRGLQGELPPSAPWPGRSFPSGSQRHLVGTRYNTPVSRTIWLSARNTGEMEEKYASWRKQRQSRGNTLCHDNTLVVR